MIKEIINTYKFYNAEIKWKNLLLIYGIFTSISASIVVKLTVNSSNAINIINLLSVYVFFYISTSHSSSWDKNRGYGKFIRTIPDAYRKFTIIIIILSLLEAIIYFIIFYILSSLILRIFKIYNYISMYKIFYMITIGILTSGLGQILNYCFKNKKLEFVGMLILFCTISELSVEIISNLKIINILSMPAAYITAIVFIAIYLCIVYKVIFKRIKMGWQF